MREHGPAVVYIDVRVASRRSVKRVCTAFCICVNFGTVIASLGVMEIGMYGSAGALNALEAWQQVLSHNIASSTVSGFKATEVAIEGKPMAKMESVSQSAFQQIMAGTTPKVVEKVSFKDGPIMQTGQETDIGIQGKGFFKVRTSGGKELYTRDGQFHFNADGTLVNAAGHAVEGDGGPIVRDITKGPIQMNKQGQLYQGNDSVGSLALFDIPDSAKMLRTEGGFIPEDPFTGISRVTEPRFSQGFVEQSNVAPINEMVNLIKVSTLFEANHKVIQEGDNLQSKAIDNLGSK